MATKHQVQGVGVDVISGDGRQQAGEAVWIRRRPLEQYDSMALG
jgi:hypothetical protein